MTPYDVVTPYWKYVQENLRLGRRKLKVVVDAGNGTGGVVAVPLLEALGVEVVPLFIEMDGRFPNHHADPTVEKNLEHLKAGCSRPRRTSASRTTATPIGWARWTRRATSSGATRS